MKISHRLAFFVACAGWAAPLFAATPADFAASRDILSVPLGSPRLVQIREEAGVKSPEFIYLEEIEAGMV